MLVSPGILGRNSLVKAVLVNMGFIANLDSWLGLRSKLSYDLSLVAQSCSMRVLSVELMSYKQGSLERYGLHTYMSPRE